MNEFDPGPILKKPPRLAESAYGDFFDQSFINDFKAAAKTGQYRSEPLMNFYTMLDSIDYTAAEHKDWRLDSFYIASDAVEQIDILSPHMQRFCRLLLNDDCSDMRYAAATYLNPPKRGLKVVSNNAPTSKPS